MFYRDVEDSANVRTRHTRLSILISENIKLMVVPMDCALVCSDTKESPELYAPLDQKLGCRKAEGRGGC